MVGEATCEADLAAWAAHGGQPGVLAAGASEFFGAYLRALGHPPVEHVPEAVSGGETRDLFVCGSTSAGSRAFCRQSEARGVPVLRLPNGLLQQPVDEPAPARWLSSGRRRSCVRCARASARHCCHRPAALSGTGHATGAGRVSGLRRSSGCWIGHGDSRLCRRWRDGGGIGAPDGVDADARAPRVGDGGGDLAVEGQDAPLVSMKPGSYTWPEAILA